MTNVSVGVYILIGTRELKFGTRNFVLCSNHTFLRQLSQSPGVMSVSHVQCVPLNITLLAGSALYMWNCRFPHFIVPPSQANYHAFCYCTLKTLNCDHTTVTVVSASLLQIERNSRNMTFVKY